jgi:hypothetical protein
MTPEWTFERGDEDHNPWVLRDGRPVIEVWGDDDTGDDALAEQVRAALARPAPAAPEAETVSGVCHECGEPWPCAHSRSCDTDSDCAHYRVATAATEDGAALIAAERRRQIEVEGYDPEHDEPSDDLARAAVAYALPYSDETRVAYWPWGVSAFKPKDRLRDLVRAGALIAAAIDAEVAP